MDKHADERPASVDQAALDLALKTAILESLNKKAPTTGGGLLGIPLPLLLSGFGAVALALLNWFLSIQTDSRKLSNELIKTAVSAQDEEQASRNLKFLSRLGLISVSETQLEAVLADPASRPLFTVGDTGISYSVESGGHVRFEGDWEKDNIVEELVPQLAGKMALLGQIEKFDGKVRLNKDAMPSFKAAMTEIEALGLLDRILSFDGAFVPRTIRGAASRLSKHALGLAFDINCQSNRYGQSALEQDQPGSVKELAPIFEKHGYRWGGTYPTPDACHFEYIGSKADNFAQP
ncbi:MAG: M15 family metallopeptidase [Rhizobiaceae bacterium]